MKKRTMYYYECAHCGNESEDCTSESAARLLALRQGWIITSPWDGLNFCDDCRCDTTIVGGLSCIIPMRGESKEALESDDSPLGHEPPARKDCDCYDCRPPSTPRRIK
jgi:hypothetical protein